MCGTTARARPRPIKAQPPNNWQSDFGHSAWEWDEKTRQYYYHKFYIQQPDLNWNNPKVHEAFKDIIALLAEARRGRLPVRRHHHAL